MRALPALALALPLALAAGLALPLPAAAQQAAPARPATVQQAAPARPAPVLASAQPAEGQSRGGEPVVQHIVTEDDGVRIEELRVRGQTQRIIVRSKLGDARPYEIIPPVQGRDLSQDKRAVGQRVWSVLQF